MTTSDYYIQDNSDIEEKKFDAAKGLYRAGNYSGALKLYLDMVNTSYSYKLNYEIGRCYYKLNDLVNAELYFMRSVSLENYKNPSYVFLGNIFFKRQDLNKAIEYWSIAYSYKPDDESVCLNLATSYFSKEMKFESLIFYEKYLKYAKDKQTDYYIDIKKSIENFKKTSVEFYQKAQKSILMKDFQTAIQALEYAVKVYPINFDVNYSLGKIYYEQKQYMQALIYLKQAYCLDRKSLDVLEKLSTTMLELGDFTGAYCCLKRILPLFINDQKEYLEIITTLKQLESSFDRMSYQGHENWAKNYYEDNNYQLSLLEFENCILINGQLSSRLDETIQKLRSFINPEERIIKLCFEKGGIFYSNGDFKQSNKYFSKIMALSHSDSADYKFAKSRMVNV